jgi:hypothetical protein
MPVSISISDRSASGFLLFAGPDASAAPVRQRTFAPAVRSAIPPVAKRLGWVAVSARVGAATIGNYVVTALLTALLARIWPVAPAQASMAATLVAFAIFPTLAMTAFAVRSPWRLWAWLLGASAVLSVGLWLSLASGGRL